MPEEITFEFLFDNTGIIDGKAKADGIFDDVNNFRQMLTEYQGRFARTLSLETGVGQSDIQRQGHRTRASRINCSIPMGSRYAPLQRPNLKAVLKRKSGPQGKQKLSGSHAISVQ